MEVILASKFSLNIEYIEKMSVLIFKSSLICLRWVTNVIKEYKKWVNTPTHPTTAKNKFKSWHVQDCLSYH